MEENKFDFKFLNKVMYVGAFILLCLALKAFGLLDKAVELLVALTPFYIGVIICWISKPLANRLRKMGLSKGISATIALIIIFAIIILALSYIIPVLVSELTQFIKEVPSMYTSIASKVNSFLMEKFNLEYKLPSSLGEIDFLSGDMIQNVLNYSIDTAQKTGSFLISVVTAIIISFFMVKDMDRTKNSFIVLASKNGKNANRYKMLVEMDEILNSYIRGLLLDSIIVGIMTTILCLILQLKYAVIFGIMITLLNLIPYIGAVISYCITSLYAFTVGGPVLAIITFVASFIIQMIDANILQPNIIAKSVKLHPVIVICGMLVFERLFGIIGMVIAMPVLALVKIFIKYKFNINFDTDEDNKKKIKSIKKNKEKVRE